MKSKKLLLTIFFLIIIIVMIILYSTSTTSDINNTQKDSLNQINASLNAPFQLKINQTAIIKSENIKLTFLNVTEDSRCPEGTVCVWAGQVKALLLLEVNQSSHELFNLTLNFNETQSQKTRLGYTVKLLKVDPYPKSNITRNMGDYQATFSIMPAN